MKFIKGKRERGEPGNCKRNDDFIYMWYDIFWKFGSETKRLAKNLQEFIGLASKVYKLFM
jgi:hypothetical protein